MSTVTVLLSISIALTALMPGGDGGGGESGVVYICSGKPQTFSCEVPKQQGSLTRLEWRIDFTEHSARASQSDVTRLFTSADPEGQILIDSRHEAGVTFVFSLTSNGSSSFSLVSVMNITVDNVNATALINNATVNCGNEANRKTLRIIEGPPATQMSITQDMMKVHWNAAALADHYIISLSPLIDDMNESESTFITSNTTIHLPLQYNKDYNVSVTASNCAGNSTPAKITVRVGYCTLSISELGEIKFKNDRSCGYEEGSQLSFYCRDNGNESVHIATCMKNGSWIPDPHTYKCDTAEFEVTKSDVDVCIASITASLLLFAVLAFVTGFLLGSLLVKHNIIMKSSKQDKVVSAPTPGSVPPSSVALTNQGVNIMKIETSTNEAYGCL